MNRHDFLLAIEKAINVIMLSSLVFLSVSGIYRLLSSEHSTLSLWISLLHGLLGCAFGLVVLIYGGIHFKRTLGYRKPITFFKGLLAWVLLSVAIAAGMMLFFNGRQETDTIIKTVHVVTAFIAVLFVLLHLTAYVVSVSGKLEASARFPSLPKSLAPGYAFVSFSLLALPFMLAMVSGLYDPKFSTESVVGSYQFDYGEHPFRPSQTETYHGKFLDLRQIAISAQCAECHADIAQQWVDSTHKKASSDPTYVKNINLLATKKGITATRYCEGCHAPVALLTGALTPGGAHGGQSGTPGNLEGVNCLSCHAIQSIEHLKGNASYKIGPGLPYLFEGAQQPLLRVLNRLSISLRPQQHKLDMGRSFTKTSDICATCHAQFMDKEMNNWGWVKMQDDYSAWLNGPFSGQNPRFNLAQPVHCQGCHMPLVSAHDPSANIEKQVKSHRFVAANTLTAMLSDTPTQLNETIRFLQTNKMRITIDAPNRTTASQNYKALENAQRDMVTAPFFYYLNEPVELSVIVSNVGVGHNFPGGTIDINEAWVEVNIIDAQGVTIFASGQLDAKGYVDPKAYFYRSVPVDRNGKDVWRHDLFNMMGDRQRNTVPAGASDVIKYSFSVPSEALSPLQVSVVLKYRKLNNKYLSWVFDNNAISLPIVDMARDSLKIPLKKQLDVVE